MKWFKHFSDSATTNGKLTRLLDERGLDDYARYFLLMEYLVMSVEDFSTSPKIEFNLKRWAEILRMKGKKVIPFLEYLKELAIINLKHSGNRSEVELVNHEKILSKVAISSEKRATSSHPRRDKNISKVLRIEGQARDFAQLRENPVIASAIASNPSAAQAFSNLKNGVAK